MERVDDFINQWRDDSATISAHTSGSTGTPKHIELLKSDMQASALATNTFFGINEQSTIGMALSVDYIAGKMMVVRALLSGARLAALPVSNEINLGDFDGTIDLLAIVPTQIPNFIRHPEYVHKVRNLLIGGAAPSADDCSALNKLGYTFYISYGMTETCSHVALAKGDDCDRIFHAMPGISFATTDDSRLIINAPAFSFKELTTNDVVQLISPLSFIWRGRADGVINSGGLKLMPEELETLYAPALIGLRYYVSHTDDTKWGQAVALIVEGEISTDEIAAKIAESVADHRRHPKSIFCIKCLPEAANGKIKRKTPAELNLVK